MAVHWITMRIDILLAWLWLIRFALSDCSGSGVVTLPYRNVTLQDAKFRRGIRLEIGSQHQHLAFSMAGYANNTFLWDDTVNNRPASFIEYGGIFHPNQSTTWSTTASPNITANDTHFQMFNFTGTPPQGADDLHLNTSYTLYDFPLATTHDGISMNSLGVGPESTFLQALVKDGAISSKTWSLFYGLAGEDAPSQMDGTAVFGGYDKAKIVDEKQNYTKKHDFNANCRTGMVVIVTRIDVGFVNGTEQNAYPSQMQMCLDPAFQIMSFVPEIVDILKEKFGGTSVNTSVGQAAGGLLYNANEAFTGNISVTINGNLKITVPNRQLVRPDYTSTANTTEFNDDTREVLVGVPTGDSQPKDIGILGQPFFAAAYLMVNHDLGKFTVWNGNATKEEDFYAVDSSGSACIVGSSSKSLSPGAIAGIVVGVVVGIATIVAALFTTFRYRKRKVAAKQNSHHTISSPLDPVHGERNWCPTEAPPPFELKPDGVIEAPGDISHHPAAPVEVPGDTSHPPPAPVEAPGDYSHPPPPVCELSSSPGTPSSDNWRT